MVPLVLPLVPMVKPMVSLVEPCTIYHWCHWQNLEHMPNSIGSFGVHSLGPYNYQKALYTGKHYYLPKRTEKTHAKEGSVCPVNYHFMCVG